MVAGVEPKALAIRGLCRHPEMVVKNICKIRKEGLAINRRGVHIAPLVGCGTDGCVEAAGPAG